MKRAQVNSAGKQDQRCSFVSDVAVGLKSPVEHNKPIQTADRAHGMASISVWNTKISNITRNFILLGCKTVSDLQKLSRVCTQALGF